MPLNPSVEYWHCPCLSFGIPAFPWFCSNLKCLRTLSTSAFGVEHALELWRRAQRQMCWNCSRHGRIQVHPALPSMVSLYDMGSIVCISHFCVGTKAYWAERRDTCMDILPTTLAFKDKLPSWLRTIFRSCFYDGSSDPLHFRNRFHSLAILHSSDCHSTGTHHLFTMVADSMWITSGKLTNAIRSSTWIRPTPWWPKPQRKEVIAVWTARVGMTPLLAMIFRYGKNQLVKRWRKCFQCFFGVFKQSGFIFAGSLFHTAGVSRTWDNSFVTAVYFCFKTYAIRWQRRCANAVLNQNRRSWLKKGCSH